MSALRKLVFLCRRRPDVTHDRYVEWLLGEHVPLALRHHPTLRRYVVNVVEDRLSAASADYDGFAELEFPPGEMERGIYLSSEGQAEIEADMPRFIGTVHAYLVGEYVERW